MTKCHKGAHRRPKACYTNIMEFYLTPDYTITGNDGDVDATILSRVITECEAQRATDVVAYTVRVGDSIDIYVEDSDEDEYLLTTLCH